MQDLTPVARDEASPWGAGALYTGSITLMALAAALAWTHGRPGPRRRQPDIPAPSWADARHRR